MAKDDDAIDDCWKDIRPAPKPAPKDVGLHGLRCKLCGAKGHSISECAYPGGKAKPCEICKTRENVRHAPDPYRSEINNDPTPRWLCGSCRSQRAEDV